MMRSRVTKELPRQYHHHVLQQPQQQSADYIYVTADAIILRRQLQRQRNILLTLTTILGLFLVLLLLHPNCSDHRTSTSCSIDLGNYQGPRYHSVESGTIGEPKCLLQSKWMSVSLHTVRFPGSEETYDDWMWVDYHDRINVLVEDSDNNSTSRTEAATGDERRFWVMEQTKYALEGKASLAIIGGIIELGEAAEQAARREVSEELQGVSCQKFHFLGRYRTGVNRGMGWLNSFLATQCDSMTSKHNQSEKNMHFSRSTTKDEIGATDTESQTIKSISLKELRDAAIAGKFLEVQWTATVSLALLHLELG